MTTRDDSQAARLAHKRTLDRKAQNAKRERTRLRIQTLEQQLAACERANAQLEAENARLRAGQGQTVPAPPPEDPVLDAERPHLYSALPCNAPPTCLSDDIIDTFLQSQRAAAVPDHGIEQPNVLSLLLPKNAVALSPVLRVTSDVLRAFADIATLPEQVAGLCLMFGLVDWRAHPTLERYRALPEWLRPLPVQLRVPHPAWMDAIPWPKVRAHLVSRPHDYDFDAWSAVYAPGLTVSWPYHPGDCIVAVARDAVVASPVFAQHWRDLRNWNTSAAFKRRYPEVALLIEGG